MPSRWLKPIRSVHCSHATAWPSSENDTSGYIADVARRTGINPHQRLTPAQLGQVAQAMARHEGFHGAFSSTDGGSASQHAQRARELAKRAQDAAARARMLSDRAHRLAAVAANANHVPTTLEKLGAIYVANFHRKADEMGAQVRAFGDAAAWSWHRAVLPLRFWNAEAAR